MIEYFGLSDDFTCWIEGKIETVAINKTILFWLIYQSPGAVPDEFFYNFECFMSRIRASNLDCMYVGDFNFKRLNINGMNLNF